MLQQPSKVIIAIAAIFVAVISGAAYLIFSFSPHFIDTRTSLPSTPESTQSIQPVVNGPTSCAEKSADEIPSCCSNWAQQQTNLKIPDSCTPKWDINSEKSCVYTCVTQEALPI